MAALKGYTHHCPETNSKSLLPPWTHLEHISDYILAMNGHNPSKLNALEVFKPSKSNWISSNWKSWNSKVFKFQYWKSWKTEKANIKQLQKVFWLLQSALQPALQETGFKACKSACNFAGSKSWVFKVWGSGIISPLEDPWLFQPRAISLRSSTLDAQASQQQTESQARTKHQTMKQIAKILNQKDCKTKNKIKKVQDTWRPVFQSGRGSTSGRTASFPHSKPIAAAFALSWGIRHFKRNQKLEPEKTQSMKTWKVQILSLWASWSLVCL